MKKKRKHLSASEKVKIVKKVLLDKEPISEVCKDYGISPSQFYCWQKQLFEGAEDVLQRRTKPLKSCERTKISRLEEKLRAREEAVSELLSEYVALKKSITGEV